MHPAGCRFHPRAGIPRVSPVCASPGTPRGASAVSQDMGMTRPKRSVDAESTPGHRSCLLRRPHPWGGGPKPAHPGHAAGRRLPGCPAGAGLPRGAWRDARRELGAPLACPGGLTRIEPILFGHQETLRLSNQLEPVPRAATAPRPWPPGRSARPARATGCRRQPPGPNVPLMAERAASPADKPEPGWVPGETLEP